MEAIIIYVIKASIAITLFYGLYLLLLKNDTFFKIRRSYLLIALFFSLLYPFTTFESEQAQEGGLAMSAYMMSEVVIFVTTNTVDTASSTGSINIFSVLCGAIAIGVAVLSIRFAVQLLGLLRVLKRNEEWEIITLEDEKTPSFSFFNYIVVNTLGKSPTQIQDIITHEMAHMRQWHSVDALLYELFCIFFWWNPFAWLMKNEVKLNLEYLADEEVVCVKEDYKEYQCTLLQISTANAGAAFINNFNISHLKKRITMMNKKRTPKFNMGKLLFVLPLAFALLLGNVTYATNPLPPANQTTPEAKQEPKKGQVFTVVEHMPSYPGGEAEMMKFVGSNLVYPAKAQEVGAQGRVIVRFVVSKTGELTDVTIIKNGVELGNKLDEIIVVGYAPDKTETKTTISKDDVMKVIDEECIRMIKSMPNWNPGKQNGKVVDVFFTLPILFRLK